MKRIVMVLLLAAWPAIGHAGLPASELGTVSVDVKPDAHLPLSVPFLDEGGKTVTLGDLLGGVPAVLVFADYTCTNLCGPILAFAADGLEKTNLTPVRDYRLIVIGIDPKDTLADAEAMKKSRVGNGSALARATTLLRGTQSAVDSMTSAAGYHYVYDSEHDQFAHPAAAYVLTAEGHVARVLSGIGIDAADLRLALVDAGKGKVGTLADQVRLLCYGFDPTLGIYTENITLWLAIGGVATLAALGGGILTMVMKTRGGAAT